MLVDVFKKVKNIVVSTNVEMPDLQPRAKTKPRVHAPYEPFVVALGADGACLGNAYVAVDKDGLVRKTSLVFEKFGHSTAFYKSFSLRIAEKFLGARSMVDQSHEHVFSKTKSSLSISASISQEAKAASPPFHFGELSTGRNTSIVNDNQ